MCFPIMAKKKNTDTIFILNILSIKWYFINIFDHLLTPSPPLQNDNGSQHFYQLSGVSGGPIGQ